MLFPDTRLPLHIFEPRYRQMTEDALQGDRVIGMVLPSTSLAAPEPTPVFEVGCAGRIGNCRRLPDGRFNLVLEGLRRYRIVREEQGDRLYRVVEAELLPDPAFGELDPDARAELEDARDELEDRVIDLARASERGGADELRRRMRRLDPVQLVHALAFGLDCSTMEKQSLLEAPDPVTRCRLLAGLIEFRRAENAVPDAPRSVN